MPQSCFRRGATPQPPRFHSYSFPVPLRPQRRSILMRTTTSWSVLRISASCWIAMVPPGFWLPTMPGQPAMRTSRDWPGADRGDTGLRGRPRSGDRRRGERRRHGPQRGRAFVDRSAAVHRACGEQPDEVSGVIRSAFGAAIDRQSSAGLDRARAAITGSVRQHFSWNSAAMKRVAPDRRLAGHGGRLSVGRRKPRNPTNRRQDKSADRGRAYVVGCAGLFGHLLPESGWHFWQFR
jgi:hypothetical protein